MSRTSRRQKSVNSRRLRFESLERRRVMAASPLNLVVNTIGDLPDINPGDGIAADVNGNTSLRAAIQEVNAQNGPTATIDFLLPGSDLDASGRFVIQPNSALPTVNQPVTIQTSLASGVATNFPWVEIDGSNVGGATADGIRILGDNVTIEALAVSNFPGDGIEVFNADSATIDEVFSFNNDGNGLRASNSASLRINEGAFFANGKNGIQVAGSGSVNAEIIDNLVGVEESGTSVVANGNNSFGVHILSPASVVQGNTISGNARSGLVISNSDGATVQGNFIGTDPTGSSEIPNSAFGILLTRSDSNLIGGPTPQDANIVSGNDASGVVIATNSASNTVQGNLIGVPASGTGGLGNASTGVFIRAGAANNLIVGNTIAANTGTQVLIDGASTASNTLISNLVGVDRSLTQQGGGSNAILVKSPSNVFGGASPLDSNIIVAPITGTGITFSGANATNNVVQRNFVGGPVGMRTGIRLTQNAHSNTIGPENEISNNSSDAIQVTNSAGDGNKITQNRIMSNGFGIDLGANGLNVNDGGAGAVTSDDVDSGPNQLQNSASNLVVSAVQQGPTAFDFSVDFFVDSHPTNSAYPLTVEFFAADLASSTPDAVQGAEFAGESTFTVADYNAGNANLSELLDLSEFLVLPTHVTATVTDANGNTSEFSSAVAINYTFLGSFAAAPSISSFDPSDDEDAPATMLF